VSPGAGETVDDLKTLMRRFVDEFQSNGNEAVADELLADIFRNHTAPPGMSPDKQGVKAYFAAFRRAVPDLHAQVHDMLADGDKVVTRKTFHGTHTGEFMGLSVACRRPGTRSRSTSSTSSEFVTANSSSTGTCSTPSP
jgi:predicted ester cyclase